MKTATICYFRICLAWESGKDLLLQSSKSCHAARLGRGSVSGEQSTEGKACFQAYMNFSRFSSSEIMGLKASFPGLLWSLQHGNLFHQNIQAEK